MSETGQKSSYLSDKITDFSPKMLFNRVVLFPTPPEGSKLYQVLGTSIKALVIADQSTENYK